MDYESPELKDVHEKSQVLMNQYERDCVGKTQEETDALFKRLIQDLAAIGVNVKLHTKH